MPSGEFLLGKLIDLLADQEGVIITYELGTNKKEDDEEKRGIALTK